MTCKHTDGWIINEDIAISEDDNPFDSQEVECRCNHTGCFETKNFKFVITNVEEVK